MILCQDIERIAELPAHRVETLAMSCRAVMSIDVTLWWRAVCTEYRIQEADCYPGSGSHTTQERTNRKVSTQTRKQMVIL